MRTALKMVLPLIVSVAVVSVLFAWYQVRTEKRILRNDFREERKFWARRLQESVEPLLDSRAGQESAAPRRAIRRA
jgi:hypothetical protein